MTTPSSRDKTRRISTHPWAFQTEWLRHLKTLPGRWNIAMEVRPLRLTFALFGGNRPTPSIGGGGGPGGGFVMGRRGAKIPPSQR